MFGGMWATLPDGTTVAVDPEPEPVKRTGCKVEGCECKDARILNRRIARFVAARRPDATPYRDPATLTPIPASAFLVLIGMSEG